MESENLPSIIIFVLLLGLMGLIMLMYLKSIITSFNENLVTEITKSLKKNSAESKKEFEKFITILESNFDNHIVTIKKFTEHLKKETDKYSESVSKYLSVSFFKCSEKKQINILNLFQIFEII